MFELIIIIFIGVVIYKRYQRLKQDGGINGNNSLPNTTVTTPSSNNNSTQATQSRSARTTVQNRPVQSMAQPHPTGTASSHTDTRAAIQEAKEDGNSTTAYLMEKAEADAREHAKEKFEEQKRLYETRGGLAVAERYLEGESIPQGKRCVNCGYCGAENLIPMIPRAKYSCYFCREPL